jgi:ABC-2 type transport system permease protein
MLERLKIEWMKIKPYRTFWVIFIIYLVAIFGINYIIFSITEAVYQAKELKGAPQMLIGTHPFAFPNVWHTTTYVASWLLVLPGLLMIILCTNEFNFKTHRQNVIDGWSRVQFITVKFGIVVIMALASTIMVSITGYILGLIVGESFDSDKMVYILFYFINALSYLMTALLLALLFRRGGLGIIVFVAYIFFVDNILQLVLNEYLFPVGRYLPLQSADNLIPFPIFEQVQKQFMRPFNTTALLIVALLYLSAYFFLSFKKFEKDDL